MFLQFIRVCLCTVRLREIHACLEFNFCFWSASSSVSCRCIKALHLYCNIGQFLFIYVLIWCYRITFWLSVHIVHWMYHWCNARYINIKYGSQKCIKNSNKSEISIYINFHVCKQTKTFYYYPYYYSVSWLLATPRLGRWKIHTKLLQCNVSFITKWMNCKANRKVLL